MAYTLDISLTLGSAKAGLADLRAQLVNTGGANVGAAVSTGFTEIDSGMYLWHYAAFPDGHRGGVRFYSNATPAATLAFVSVNPEEAENADAKTSTRSTLAAGAQMDLVDAPNATARDALATTVEAHLLDEGDAQMLINAIVGAIGNVNVDEVALIAAIRADLERAGGNLNTIVGRLTAQRAANLDSITEARLAELDAANLPADLDTVKTNAAAILADTGTDGVVVAAASKTGYKLAGDGLDAVMVEAGLNFRQSQSIICAATAGVLSGAATPTILIAAAGVPATIRITATTDADGNRTAVVLTPPA